MTTECSGKASEREISEQLARCVATMVYCQAEGWSWSGAQFLAEEARSLFAWATRNGMNGNLDEIVLAPLEGELSGRFGPKLGHKLHREFRRALHDAGER